MIKQDLKNLLAAEQQLDVSDGQVDAWVEAARQMVLSADGIHIWRNLIVKTTLPLVANVSSYTFPSDGSGDPPIDKLLYVEGQNTSDTPLRVFSEEEAAETDFGTTTGGIVWRPTSQPGQITLIFKATPTAASTMDVVYGKVPGDDLDFIKQASHDVFIFASRVIAPLKGVAPTDMAMVRLQNYRAYLERLQAAIANDYTATQENMRTIPPLPTRQLMDTFSGFQGDRD